MIVGSARSRTGGQALALVAASILAAAPIAGLTHLEAVRHDTCAEHGELVEVAIHDHADGEQVVRAALDVEPIADARHGHDHCVLAAAGRARSIGPDRTPALGEPVAHTALAHPGSLDLAPPPPIALLSLAPKSSPPA